MTSPLQPRTVTRCPLDGVAAAVGTVGELCAGPAIGIRFHEFAAPYDQVVRPLCWLGPGDRATYDLHTASVPPSGCTAWGAVRSSSARDSLSATAR